MVTELATTIKKVDKIFHIADVHLRNHLRHDEYQEVFKKLYKFLKKNKTKDSIIYLAGDIVHAKTDISPELVLMLSNFFKSLADICPTLVILGNHDLNLKNNSRLNIIKPVVELLNHPQLYFLEKNGYYKFAQIGISLLEVSTNVSDFQTAEGLDSPVKVAFYHGPLNLASMENNIKITSSQVSLDTFKGFDLALLGDIHKRQLLQFRNVDEMEVEEEELEFYLNQGWEIVNA